MFHPWDKGQELEIEILISSNCLVPTLARQAIFPLYLNEESHCSEDVLCSNKEHRPCNRERLPCSSNEHLRHHRRERIQLEQCNSTSILICSSSITSKSVTCSTNPSHNGIIKWIPQWHHGPSWFCCQHGTYNTSTAWIQKTKNHW